MQVGFKDPEENPSRGEVLTSDSPGRTTRSGRTAAETRCCPSSSGGTGGPSDKWTPAPGTDAPPPGCSGHGNPSST